MTGEYEGKKNEFMKTNEIKYKVFESVNKVKEYCVE